MREGGSSEGHDIAASPRHLDGMDGACDQSLDQHQCVDADGSDPRALCREQV